jgi:hypothetical protein
MPAFVRDLVAITLSTGGATADVPRRVVLQPDDRWYFPRFPELTRIVPLADLEAAFSSFIADHLATFDDTVRFGAWINPTSRTCYLDLITHVPTEAQAELLAHRYGREAGRPVVAIYNPLRRLTTYLNYGSSRPTSIPGHHARPPSPPCGPRPRHRARRSAPNTPPATSVGSVPSAIDCLRHGPHTR